MPVTASRLRQNVYRLLDEVLETGIPLEVERRGRLLKVVPMEKQSKLDRIAPKPEFLRCDPDDLVHLDWSEEWRP